MSTTHRREGAVGPGPGGDMRAFDREGKGGGARSRLLDEAHGQAENGAVHGSVRHGAAERSSRALSTN